MKLEAFIKIVSENVIWLPIVLAVCLTVLLIIIIIKVIKGTITISFWGLKIESNKAVDKVQKLFDELNMHSQLKTQVIKLLNQSMITVSQWGNLPSREFQDKVKSFYNFYLPGIISLITKQRDNTHRVAIFHQFDNESLKILHGSGYSPEGVEKLKLGLKNSKAGYCFINEEQYYNKDITNDSSYVRNPKSSKEYKSLLCVPITYNNKTIGVLNIDGLKSNSFDKDDIDYITYFANSISPLLYKELLYKDEINKREALYHEKERNN